LVLIIVAGVVAIGVNVGRRSRRRGESEVASDQDKGT
jgi:hypothetical protein